MLTPQAVNLPQPMIFQTKLATIGCVNLPRNTRRSGIDCSASNPSHAIMLSQQRRNLVPIKPFSAQALPAIDQSRSF
jgi:hypothetical protein